jgi:hypothetical protein
VLENESRGYAKTASFEAKNTILIQPTEHALQQDLDAGKEPRLSHDELDRCAASLWEFDRIYYYLVQERSGAASIERLVEAADQEFERVRALDGGASLIPLHYAIRALKRQFRQRQQDRNSGEQAGRIRRLLTHIKRLVDELGLDKGQQLRDGIDDFQTLLDEHAAEPIARYPAETAAADGTSAGRR